MSTFRGYDTDLLISLKAHGRALVGDDALYDAAQAYTDPATGGGVYGRALLDVAPQRAFPASARDVDDDTVERESAMAIAEEDEDASPWDAYDLITLRDLLKANNVEFPRTMTKGGAIKRLDAANISPPT